MVTHSYSTVVSGRCLRIDLSYYSHPVLSPTPLCPGSVRISNVTLHSTVTTVHNECYGSSPGAHPQATELAEMPNQKLLLPNWDPQVVLRAHSLPLLEPLSSLYVRLRLRTLSATSEYAECSFSGCSVFQV